VTDPRPVPAPTAPGWPAELVLVRHGESVGNLAAKDASTKGLARLELDIRDPDTPLSDNGIEQARVLGEHLGRWPAERLPEVVLASPYARAAMTTEHTLAALRSAPRTVADERVRERDLGLFDGLTGAGIRELHPEESERREAMGKFYYRPPGGESWVDVVLRVRSLLQDVRIEHPDRRVWVFTHQAVIMAFRYVLESLTEEDVLDIDRGTPLANCSLTTYRRGPHGLELEAYGAVEHLERSASAETTHEQSGSAAVGDTDRSGGSRGA
jgi:broad specificity phosphatase PhoE